MGIVLSVIFLCHWESRMIKSSKSYKEGRGRHLPPLLQAVRGLGYTVFEYGTYDLNIIGVRKEVRDDVFCDDLYVAYLYVEDRVLRVYNRTHGALLTQSGQLQGSSSSRSRPVLPVLPNF